MKTKPVITREVIARELREQADFGMEDVIYCLHCDKNFKGAEVRVEVDPDDAVIYLHCPHDCDGDPLDWSPRPWWRDQPEETPRPGANGQA